METQYRGITIKYFEDDAKFCTVVEPDSDTPRLSSATLKNLKEAIDRKLDAAEKFKRFDALWKRYGEIRRVTVTSEDDSRVYKRYRISFKQGNDTRREIVGPIELFALSDHNLEIERQFNEISAQIDVLRTKLSELAEQLESPVFPEQ